MSVRIPVTLTATGNQIVYPYPDSIGFYSESKGNDLQCQGQALSEYNNITELQSQCDMEGGMVSSSVYLPWYFTCQNIGGFSLIRTSNIGMIIATPCS